MLIVTLGLITSAVVSSVNASPLSKRYSTTCGILGFDKSPSYFYSTNATLSNFAGCESACNANADCLSFSVGYSQPQCNLYALSLIQNVNPMDIYNDFVFYDKGCTVELVPVVGTPGLPQPPQVCGVKGYDVDTRAYYLTPASTSLGTWASCNTVCQADPNCHSFATVYLGCYLYFVGAVANINPIPSSIYTFYDRNCPAPAVSSSASPVASSTLSAVVEATPPPYTPENTLNT